MTGGPVLHNREAYRHRLVGLHCLAQMKPIQCVSCKCEKFKKVLDGEVGVDEPCLSEDFIHSYVPSHRLIDTVLSHSSLPFSFTNIYTPKRLLKECSCCAPIFRSTPEVSAFSNSGICLCFFKK